MKRNSKLQELRKHPRQRRVRRDVRSTRRNLQLENLEVRNLLATGPTLIGVNPNSALVGITPDDDAVLRDNDVLHTAPRELVFRFDETIDRSTLSGVVVTRSGADGEFDVAETSANFGVEGIIAHFRAKTPGPSGNNITITLAPGDTGDEIGSQPPEVSIRGANILVEIFGQTSAQEMIDAINLDADAKLLVEANLLQGQDIDVSDASVLFPSTQLYGANVAHAELSTGIDTDAVIGFTAVQSGQSENGIQIELNYRDFLGSAAPIVQTVGRSIRITLNSSLGNETKVSEVIDGINNSFFASQLIKAFVVVGDADSTIRPGLGTVVLDDAGDIEIVPGYKAVVDDQENHVVVRFADTLPDDIYSIDILGNGPNAILGTVIPEDEVPDGRDVRQMFELDLGARILAVVPQPVREDTDGNLTQATNEIDVYFNDDDLDPVSATNPDFYQLVFTGHTDQFEAGFDTVTNTDDEVFVPLSVQYDADEDKAVLDFGNDPLGLVRAALGETFDATSGTFRLRIGTDERFSSDSRRLPSAPVQVDLNAFQNLPRLVTDFGTANQATVTMTARGDLATAIELRISGKNRGSNSNPSVSVVQNTIYIDVNTNVGDQTSVQQLIDAVDGKAGHLLSTSFVEGDGNAAIPLSEGENLVLTITGHGSSFATATDITPLGDINQQSVIISSAITAQDYPLAFPGAIEELGHRDINAERHINPAIIGGDASTGITTLKYNFQDLIGEEPSFFNLITNTQKERAREIFEAYGHYLGIDFIETENEGLIVSTGDMRATGLGASAPGGLTYGFNLNAAIGPLLVLDAAERWYDSYGDSDNPSRESWHLVAMTGIGGALGLGKTFDLPPFATQGHEDALRFDNVPEEVYPGDSDIVHGQYLYRPESKDIDLYRFELAESGYLSAETIAERRDQTSLLDTVLNLYRQNDDGSYELIARNDDYFSEDSFIGVDIEAGTYFVGVSASGNGQYDPTREDTGLGGTSNGEYDLRLRFRRTVASTIVDLGEDAEDRIAIDGDADGVPGGTFNYWFRVGETHFVHKDGTAVDGTLPHTRIGDALAAANEGDVVRVLGSAGADGDLSTLADNSSYEVGFGQLGNQLADGSLINVPKGVTLVVDQGAILKMRRSLVNVGSSAVEIDRSGAALQVLGTPDHNVIFTSFNDDGTGLDSDSFPQTPRNGDWGGLVIRNDTDRANDRFDYERQGIFLNHINQADIRYGGANVVVDSVEQTFTPIHLIDARPTISYNTITNTAKAAISANPDSFEETNFHAPEFQSIPFTADYDRVGPDIHGNILLDNSINALFVRIDTRAGNEIEQLTVSGRWDDTDVPHVISENLEIQGTPGGPFNTNARTDASLVIDPGVIAKFDGAGIEVEVGAQLIAEGRPGAEVIMTSVLDDRFGAGGTFDTSNNGSGDLPGAGDWTGIYWSPFSRGSLDHSLLAHGGGITKIEGSFAGFNTVEIRQAEVRIANSVLEHNANGLGGQSSMNRAGQGRNEAGTIYVLGSQPVLLNNVITDSVGGVAARGPAININANSLNSRLLYDYGRSTGHVGLQDLYRDNRGPLIRDNRLDNNDINGMIVRGATLTTESVWDDTDMVHVLLDTIYVPDFHTYGGLRLQSSATESLVVKLSGGPDAGFTATGRPLDIDDRIGGTIQIIGQPDHPVFLTSLSDSTVGAGKQPNGSPQVDTNNIADIPDDGNAFNIDLNFGPNITQNPSVAASVERAARIWEALLQDPITVTFDVEFGTTPPGVAGTASGERVIEDYDTVRSRLLADAKPSEAIVQELPLFSELQATFTDDAEINVDSNMTLTRANAKALGLDVSTSLIPSAYDASEIRDGVITISTTSNSPDADVFDVMVHEIGHALGFTSSIDLLDSDPEVTDIRLNPFDLFRLAPGDGARDFRNSPRLLDPTADQVFYDGGIFNPAGIPINGLTTGDIPLSTGATNGDGFMGSHWKNSSLINNIEIGVMDPVAGRALSPQDHRAFDLIGFDINDATGTGPKISQALPGDWGSITFDQYSNDRNVEVITEFEPAFKAEDANNNDSPLTAELLGQLAANEKGGDDSRRLGFEVHGFLYDSTDQDVYSFQAQAGTEVWLDIDRTTNLLDTTIELIDANGTTLARSDNSQLESVSGAVSNPGPGQAPSLLGRPLGKTLFYAGDQWTTNVSDAGMRVILPGGTGAVSTYHVRVGNSQANSGAFGVYELQVRLQETDEVSGSTVRYADIRYADDGVRVLGLPKHSPLVGETSEANQPNDTRATAQSVGNVMTQDRAAISVAGFLDAPEDVDWYQFEVEHESTEFGGSDTSLVFDIDYADGFGRPDTSLWVFNEDGVLVLFNRDGLATDDSPAPTIGNTLGNLGDLSRGTSGDADPFIGPVQLPNGIYYVAVSSAAYAPDVIEAAKVEDSSVPNLRLEPLDSFHPVVADHFGSLPVDPVPPPVIFSQSSAVPYFLGDVSLYVSTTTRLAMVDPYAGGLEAVVGDLSGILHGDIAIRSGMVTQPETAGRDAISTAEELLEEDNIKWGIHTFTKGNAANNEITDATVGGYTHISFEDASQIFIGDDGIVTSEDGATPDSPMAAPVISDVGITFEAMTYIGSPAPGMEEAQLLYAIGNRIPGPGNEEFENVLYRFNPNTGEAITNMMDRTGAEDPPDQVYLGAGTELREIGFIDTSARGGPGGKIMGMAALGSTVYAVSDRGGLWRVNTSETGMAGSVGTLINTVTTPDGGRISFAGLTAGPTTVEGGRYRSMLFGITTSGELFAMNNRGELQPIFKYGSFSTQTGSGGGVTGLAFGTLEVNPWKLTGVRAADEGHGLPTSSRDDPTLGTVTGTHTGGNGGASFRFGRDFVDTEESLESNEGNTPTGTYNFPGGAHGSVVSEPFSLKDFEPTDEPQLYFNYFLDTENVGRDKLQDGASNVDALRVYVSDDTTEENRGRWHLVATNNWTGAELADPDDQDTINLGGTIPVAALFDVADWRQASISLRDFAGSDSLRLRFDFATSGMIGLGSTAGRAEGQELRAIDANRIQDGETFRISGGNTFEFDFGYELLPSAGIFIDDGETFTFTDANGTPFTFEFDANQSSTPGNVPIPFTETQSALSIAKTIESVIDDSAAVVSMDRNPEERRINLIDATNLIVDANTEAFTVVGTPGVAPGNAAVMLEVGMDSEDVKDAIVDSFATTLAGGNRDSIKHYQDTIKVVDYRIVSPGPLSSNTSLVAEDLLPTLYGNDPSAIGPAGRAQSNTFEGAFIDDIVIGFASRGELVYGESTPPTETFVEATPEVSANPGPYQLEIRRASETAAGAFGINERISESVSVDVAAGVEISPNSTFSLSNGTTTRTFEFIDVSFGDPAIPTNSGAITIAYTPDDTATEIATKIVETVNQLEQLLKITAGLTGGGSRVDLFGEVVLVNTTAASSSSTTLSAFATEPNDLESDAIVTGVEPGQSTTFIGRGQLGDTVGNDVDVFALELAIGDRVRLRSFFESGFGTDIVVGTESSTAAEPGILDFTVRDAGTYFIEISSLLASGNYGLSAWINGGPIFETVNERIGDDNQFRDQGQVLIHSNTIRNSLGFGIEVEATQRDAEGNPVSIRNLQEINDDRFVPSVTINNNLLVENGAGGIRFSGDANPGGAQGAIPFGRIVNNTIYGGSTGIQVENSASPTILNTIVANTGTGVSVDATSQTTILGGMLFQGNGVNGTSNGDFPVFLADDDPLFVDPANNNFYLAFGSKAIDSSIDSLEDRPELVTVRDPLGIPLSPITAPSRDLLGQLRVDDPSVDSPSGLGEDVFKDRGAIERADFRGIIATLRDPVDNDINDLDGTPTIVQTFETLSKFTIALQESNEPSDPFAGTGANDATVNSGVVSVTSNGRLLEEGVDYGFVYDSTNDVIELLPLAGIWETDRSYIITLDNSANTGIRDLANNPLRANREGQSNEQPGTTQFTIKLGGTTDYGDAPNSYSTLAADDGPSHQIGTNLFLGTGIDSEPDGLPGIAAGSDSDDGVTFPNQIRVGNEIVVSVVSSANGLLNAWWDFDANGSWSPEEQFLANEVVTPGLNEINVTIPGDAAQTDTYVRFRVTTDANLGFQGPASDGEVEDYRVTVLDPGSDFGDAPQPFPTLLAGDGARHAIQPGFYLGSGVDAETDGQTSPLSDGDGSDDDGVIFNGNLLAGLDASITVTASQAGVLDAWIDLNSDGDWNDANEYVVSGQALVAGANELTFPLDTLEVGSAVVRFRLTSTGISSPTGLANDGEVEDYRVIIEQPIVDFGDAPSSYPVALGNNGARHVLTPGFFLGSSVDPEDNGQPTPSSNGDGSDEDGVNFPAEMFSGTNVSLSILAGAAGLVDGWIDFNRDGDWDDAEEQILTSESVVTGLNTVNIAISNVARTGTTHARFRFSSEGGLTPSGLAPDGEVEDYEVSLLASSWHNFELDTDVNGINGTTPIDALLIINELSDRTVSDEVTGVLDLPSNPPPYYDVNNDGVASPIDALNVINAIPQGNIGTVQAPLGATAIAPPVLDEANLSSDETSSRRDTAAKLRRNVSDASDNTSGRQLHDVALRSYQRPSSTRDSVVSEIVEDDNQDDQHDSLDDFFSSL